MYPAKFDYYAPTTVKNAVALLRKNKDAKILAGGHSLLPLMKLRLAQPSALVDISHVKELSGIREKGNWIVIGAMTTHRQIESSSALQKKCSLLPQVASVIGDLQVRNRGTIGGSLSHADPAADYPAAMLALGAEFDVVGAKGKRPITADSFFKGLFDTALKPGEVLTAIRVPKTSAKGVGAAYAKFPHPASRFAVVGVAVMLKLQNGKCVDVRVGVTGAMDYATHAKKMEAALRGKTIDDALVASASALASDGLQCMSDLAASSEYRAHLVHVYARRALEDGCPFLLRHAAGDGHDGIVAVL